MTLRHEVISAFHDRLIAEREEPRQWRIVSVKLVPVDDCTTEMLLRVLGQFCSQVAAELAAERLLKRMSRCCGERRLIYVLDHYGEKVEGWPREVGKEADAPDTRRSMWERFLGLWR